MGGKGAPRNLTEGREGSRGAPKRRPGAQAAPQCRGPRSRCPPAPQSGGTAGVPELSQAGPRVQPAPQFNIPDPHAGAERAVTGTHGAGDLLDHRGLQRGSPQTRWELVGRACSDPGSPTSSRAWHRASFSPRPSQTLRQARATEFSFSQNARPAFHLLQTQGGAPPRPAAPRASPGPWRCRVWRLPCCSLACGVGASHSEGAPAVSHPSC